MINVWLILEFCLVFVSGNYWSEKQKILQKEKSTSFGHEYLQEFNSKYRKANEIIIRLKQEELLRGHKNESDFLPAQNFIESKARIAQSQIYSLIRKMPKGADLHNHLTSSVSADFVFNLTFEKHLYGCTENGVFKLQFLTTNDIFNVTVRNCKPLEDLRETYPSYNDFLRSKITLYKHNAQDRYRRIEDVWSDFKNTFSVKYDFISYRPVFEKYVYQALKELFLDNIQYVEFRAVIYPIYELNGTIHNPIEFMHIMKRVVDRFKSDNKDFIGVGFINSPYRDVDNRTLTIYLNNFASIKNAYPDFVVGFDLVGYEDKSKPLEQLVWQLQEAVGGDFKLFLHAGETNWYGHTDLNLVDAVLLNVSRIGHGIALTKHPEVLRLVKENNIAIEICPISNQMLRFVEDPRLHPAVHLVAEGGYKLVVGSDDGGVWGAGGLSFDWYYFFMAMCSENTGIEVLVELSINSILYSNLNVENKILAVKALKKKWDRFVDELVDNGHN